MSAAVCCLMVDVDGFLPRAASAVDDWPERTRRALSRVIDDELQDEPDAKVDESPPDEWLVVLRAPSAHDLARRADRLAAAIHQRIRAAGDVTVTVAVGRVIPASDDVAAAISSARQAHLAKLALGPDRVISADVVARKQDSHAPPTSPHDVHRDVARAIARGERDRARRLLMHGFSSAANEAGGDDEFVRRWLLGQVLSATAVLNGRLGVGTASDWMAVCAAVPYPALAELADLHEPAAVHMWSSRVVAALAAQHTRTSHTTTLELIRRHVDQHFTDPQLRLKSVASTVGVSPFHISHLFRSELNTTFRDYVTQRRVRHATRLLEQTHLGMVQVARASGFGTSIQLRKVLVRETGATPSTIREAAREKSTDSGDGPGFRREARRV